MHKVVVYSQPSCSPCRQVKSWLEAKGITYEEKDITTDPKAHEALLSLGYRGVPVIQTATDSWSGINLPKMKELANA